MKILITSGGCKVPIDDVRHIGNFSSGRYGASLAAEFYNRGESEIKFFHEVGSFVPWGTVDQGRGAKWNYEINSKIEYIPYKYYEDYLQVKDIIKEWQPNIIISTAAISDYIVDKTEGKISSDSDELVIRLKKGEKVIQSFRELAPKATIIGFKLLVSPTKEEKYNAISKQMNYVDQVVFNDLTELRKGDSLRELVYWAEDGRIGSSRYTVNELVEEIAMTHALTSILK